MNYEEDLEELDRIWPLGKQLIVPDGGTVLVAGAYEGRYMHYICTRFKPGTVHGFEPQADKAAVAEDRLRKHGQLTKVFRYGIGVQDCIAFLHHLGTDGASIGQWTPEAPTVRLRGINGILDDHGPIDLFICNMEGYEIPLLSYLCATGRISEIQSLAVQLHTEDIRVPWLLTQHYSAPLYDDLPTWGYWSGLRRTSAYTDTTCLPRFPTHGA